MMIPVIHLNGTSREELVRQCQEATVALRLALARVHDMAPNGRDYYPLGSTALYFASIEHAERVEKLRNVLTDVETLWSAVADA